MLLPHFTPEEMGAHRSGVTCLGTQLVGDRVRVDPKTVLLDMRDKGPD